MEQSRVADASLGFVAGWRRRRGVSERFFKGEDIGCWSFCPAFLIVCV